MTVPVQLSVRNEGKTTLSGDLISVPQQIGYGTNGSVSLAISNQETLSAKSVFLGANNLVLQDFSFTNTADSEITTEAQILDVTASNMSFQNAGLMTAQNKGTGRSMRFKFTSGGEGQITFVNSGIIRTENSHYDDVLNLEASYGRLNATLTNTGSITTANPWANLVSITSNVKATINTFNIPVRNRIFHAPIDFNDSGTFVITPETRLLFTPNEDTAADTTLNLYARSNFGIFTGASDIIEGTFTNNTFGTVDPEVWKTELLTSEDAPEDWKSHKVRIYYDGQQDAGPRMNIYLTRMGRERAFRYENIIEPLKVRQTHNVFVRPYLAQSNFRFADDSTIRTSGALMGFTSKISSTYEHGLHFGYESSNFESGSDRQKADTQALSIGYHGLWRPAEKLYLKGVITGTYVENDFTYEALQAKSGNNFDAWSFFAGLNVGTVLKTRNFGDFIPELGFSFIRTDLDDFELLFNDPNLTDRKFSTDAANDAFSSLRLKWVGHLENHEGTVMIPKASLGVRALLTDRTLSSQTRFGDQSQTTLIEDDRWQGTADLSLSVLSGAVEFGMSYAGAWSQNTTSHVGWLTIGYHW